jgi:hypothetical protein
MNINNCRRESDEKEEKIKEKIDLTEDRKII